MNKLICKGVKKHLKNSQNPIFYKFCVSKSFCQKIDEKKKEEASKKEPNIMETLYAMTNEKFNEIFAKIDSQIVDYKYEVDKVPDPNSFGEAIIYLAPHSTIIASSKINNEISTIPFTLFLAFLSNLGVAFSSHYLTYYFDFIFLSAFLRLIQPYSTNSIYQINLVNESTVKIIYVSGKSEIVKIKDLEVLDNKLIEMKSPKQVFDLVLKIEGKKRVFLRIRAFNQVCFAEMNILFAIINSKIKKLSTI